MPCKKGIREDVEASKRLRAQRTSDGEIRLYDVKTDAEWRQLGFTAESRTYSEIEEKKVPEQFRALIPHAVRWSISCDVRRGDYFEKQPAEDIANFYRAVTPHLDALNRWVDELPFEEPKITFLIMLKAYSEAVPIPPREKWGPIMGKKK
jgi:hypothetical protein